MKRALAWLPSLFVAALYLFHLRVLWITAADIPYWDEWEDWPLWKPSLSLHWLFEPHNEHKLVTCRLFAWAVGRFTGNNDAVLVLVNFLLYGALLLSVLWFMKEAAPRLSAKVSICFLFFLLSPIAWTNHTSGYQSSFHFVLLFALLAAIGIFNEAQSSVKIASGVTAALLCLFSLASGVVAMLVLFAGYTLFKLSLIRKAPSRETALRHARQLVFADLGLAAGMALWFGNYAPVERYPRYAFPTQWAFWNHFFNQVAMGFGVLRISAVVGAVCFAAIVLPAFLSFRRGASSRQSWMLLSLTGALLSALATVSFGRAAFPESIKVSRYAELAIVLGPVAAAAWYVCLQHHRRLAVTALCLLWVTLFFGFLPDWDFRVYAHVYAERKAGLECVRRYYLEAGSTECPTLYPWRMDEFLELARKWRPSFYVKLATPPR